MIWQPALLYFLGLSGVGAGVLLALIAPEELLPGEKYLRRLQGVLLGLLFATGIFVLTQAREWLILAIFIVLFLTVIVISTLRTRIPHEIYFVCILPFVHTSLVTLFTVILFLYGLPTGTLLWGQKKILKQR